MKKVESRDGTQIAYDPYGDGPPLVLVTGAFATRADLEPLATALAPRFRVIAYDRRGRGDSGDAGIYALEREIDDLAALIDAAGGQAFVFGHSSGAALAIEAAVRGVAITKLALYEPPYVVDDSRPPVPDDFLATLEALAAERRHGDMVEYFWRVGLLMPAEAIAAARKDPSWSNLEAVAPTLPYDALAMDGHMAGKALPADWATQVTIPTLVIDGGASPASMGNAVEAVARLLPNAERRTLEGLGHGAPPEILGPVLVAFLLG